MESDNLRPKLLADVIGQADLKYRLQILLNASMRRLEPLCHILFDGPPGLGKTTLANVLSNELGTGFQVVTAPSVPLDVKEIAQSSAPPPLEEAPVVYEGRSLTAARVWRHDLAAGHALRGPLIVQEYSATTWVPPEWTLRVDRWGCLHLVPDARPASQALSLDPR